jgi:hypothetical protein
MLVNNNRRYYKWMACAQVVLVCLLLVNLSAFAYDAWQPDNESVAIQGLDKILEEFEMLLEKAKASKAAHPVFLSDLEDMLERLEKQRDIIADICVSVHTGYESDYVKSGFSYSEPKEIIGPDLAYLGQDDDKIGPWSPNSPDGQNDGHFQVRVYLPREVEVKNLRLYKSNYRSEKLDSWWYTDTSGAWVLGVFQNRKLLNPNREDSLGSFSGWVLLDIYAAVEGFCFDEGEYLLLEMTTSEGVLTKLFQVGGDVR